MPKRRNSTQEAAAVLLRESGCTVRKYRTSLSGVAFTRAADWGIEAPEPTTPLRFGIFAHEIGHQMLHREKGRQRWQEEVEAWAWSLQQMRRFEIPIDAVVYKRAVSSVLRALRKAHRAGSTTAPPPFPVVVCPLIGLDYSAPVVQSICSAS